MIPIGVEWLSKQTGLGASTHYHAGGFIRSRADENLTHPDLQFHFVPSQVNTLKSNHILVENTVGGMNNIAHIILKPSLPDLYHL